MSEFWRGFFMGACSMVLVSIIISLALVHSFMHRQGDY